MKWFRCYGNDGNIAMPCNLTIATDASMADTSSSSLLSSKWQDPGWRIEQRYAKGVLIGNWSEDRYKVITALFGLYF